MHVVIHVQDTGDGLRNRDQVEAALRHRVVIRDGTGIDPVIHLESTNPDGFLTVPYETDERYPDAGEGEA